MAIPQRARGSFKNLSFPKLGTEIIEAADEQRRAVLAKIEDRQRRVQEVCEKKGLDVSDFFANMDQFVGVSNTYQLQAGEQAQLREESMQIVSEKAVVIELDMIINNLPKDDTFELSFEDLKYFGF